MKRFMIAALCAVCLTGCGTENVQESAPAETPAAESSSDRTESNVIEATAENITEEETAAEEQTTPTEALLCFDEEINIPENAAYKEITLNYSIYHDFSALRDVTFYDIYDNPVLELRQATPEQTNPSVFERFYEYNPDGTKASQKYDTMHGSNYIYYEYSDGLLIKETYYINDNLRYIESYEYDEYDNVIKSIYEKPGDENYSLTTCYSYEYDGNGRLISKITENTDDYKRIEKFTYDENGQVTTHIDNDYKDEYIYDSDNRLIKLMHYDKDGLLWYNLYEYEFY